MIYLDESGNLGYGERADKYFTIAAIIAREPSQVGRCPKKIRQQKLPNRYRKIPELKFHNSSQTIRERMLDCIARTDNDIAYAVLRKEQVYDYLQDKRGILYNYISKVLICNIIKAYNIKGPLDLVIDKSLYHSQRDTFDSYLKSQASKLGVSLNPSHSDSMQDPCIQAVDYVAGATNHMYCQGNNQYYKRIEPRVSIVVDLFEGKDRNCVVNPSLLRPIRLRAASSFSGRTYNTT